MRNKKAKFIRKVAKGTINDRFPIETQYERKSLDSPIKMTQCLRLYYQDIKKAYKLRAKYENVFSK